MNKQNKARLDDFLTKKQIKEVTDYISQQVKNGLRATDTQVITGLKEILRKYRNELIIKEIDSDYLAYAIAFDASKRQIKTQLRQK